MSATRVFGDTLNAHDIWWPTGDGDALRELAATWTAAADFLDDISSVLTAAARSITEHTHGETARRFTELWGAWSSPTGYLATTSADCRRLAAAASDFGTDIDVADRTLARLVEQAFDEMTKVPTPAVMQTWLVWLAECANLLCGDLHAQAIRRSDLLTPIDIARPLLPTDVDRSTITPEQITWPDMGVPTDLSGLASVGVDFGAGPGRLPADLLPPLTPPPVIPSPLVPPGGVPTPVFTPPVTTVVVDENGTTVTVTGGSNVSPPPTVPVFPTPLTPVPPPAAPPSFVPPPSPPATPPVDGKRPLSIRELVPSDNLDDLERGGLSSSPPASTAGGPSDDVSSGFGGGSGGFGGGSIPPIPSFEPPEITMPPVDAVPPVPLTPVPSSAPSSLASAMPAAALATTAVAAAAKSSTSKGFMPMMPMGAGGMTGDEAPEPKRRPSRRLRPQA